jgi:hypothetical protein
MWPRPQKPGAGSGDAILAFDQLGSSPLGGQAHRPCSSPTLGLLPTRRTLFQIDVLEPRSDVDGVSERPAEPNPSTSPQAPSETSGASVDAALPFDELIEWFRVRIVHGRLPGGSRSVPITRWSAITRRRTSCSRPWTTVLWSSRSAHHRWTSTGILQCVSTLNVSLPRTIAEMPRRPCEAMTIRSQPFDSVVSMIAW